MTKEEFNEKMNRKNLGEVAKEKVAVFVASECKDVDVLFGGVDERIVAPADAEYIRSVLAEVLYDGDETEKAQNCRMNVIREASDAMCAVFTLMLHQMRKDEDYSGLGLLYDECDTDLPFSIYQRLGDMIFNDYFPAMNLEEHEKDSPLFRGFYDRFDRHFMELLNRANSAWESYLQPSDDNDGDDDEEEANELTFERFQQMIAAADAEDDAADDLMPSVVQLRIMKCSAYLMALADAVSEENG